MTFRIKLAGRTIEIASLYSNVYGLCADYIESAQDGQADISIRIEQSDIEYEARKSLEEGGINNFSDAYLEELAVYRKIAEGMLDYSAWLMHGSVLGINGGAHLITAASGKGKTTLTRLILKANADSFVINGDKPLMSLAENGVYAHGTPWSGKERMNTNCALPLKSITVLERGEENKLERLSFSQALAKLLQQTYRPAEPLKLKKTLALLSELGNAKRGVNLYRMTLKYYDERAQLDNVEVHKLLESAGFIPEGAGKC